MINFYKNFQIISYQLEENIAQETKEVFKQVHELIAPNDSDDWINMPIPIPSIPPSTIGESSLINLEYCILVSVYFNQTSIVYLMYSNRKLHVFEGNKHQG